MNPGRKARVFPVNRMPAIGEGVDRFDARYDTDSLELSLE
jgi:hypothetical protein